MVSLNVCHAPFVFDGKLHGALSLDVARFLALVASSLSAGLGWAFAGEMANFTTVVALLSLGAVTAHVSIAPT